jgi:hypothetical protein
MRSWQHAHRFSSWSHTGGGGYKSKPIPRADEVVLDIATLPTLVGKTIGKGAIGLHTIISATGVREIRVSEGGDTLWVVGSKENAAAAISMLEETEAAVRDGEVTKTINVPQESVGFVIGSRGAEIRKIQEDSGCRVVQMHQDNSCLIAGDEASVEAAIASIQAAVARGKASGNRGGGGGRGNSRDPVFGVVPDVFNEEPPPFEMSLSPESRQLVLKTGAVPMHRLPEVRAHLFAHTDFSDELRKVDRKTDPAEAYFLRLVANGLAKNPDMTIADKRDIVRAIRQTITGPLGSASDSA